MQAIETVYKGYRFRSRHADDNYRSGFCDWHVARKNVKGEVGKCFRGVTINRI